MNLVNEPEVKQERTGWRDPLINDIHRCFGWNCPAQDLDFIEFSNYIPVALFEYKYEASKDAFNLTSSQCRVIANLGDMAGLPVFHVLYGKNYEWFYVSPLNAASVDIIHAPIELPRKRFVSMLYYLRGTTLSEDLWHDINNRVEELLHGNR